MPNIPFCRTLFVGHWPTRGYTFVSRYLGLAGCNIDYMKRLCLILILFIGLGISQNITIAVVDFDGKGVTKIEASALTDRFATELFNLDIYTLIERERVGEILD